MSRFWRAALVAAGAVLVTACASLCPGGANCPTDAERGDTDNT